MAWQRIGDNPLVQAALQAFPGACVSEVRRPVLHDWRFEHDPEKWERVIEQNLKSYASALRVASPENRPAIKAVLGYWKMESAKLALERMPDPDQEPARGFIQRLRSEMREQGIRYRLTDKQASWLRRLISDWKRYGLSEGPMIEAEE